MKIFFEDYPYSPKDVSFLTDIALIELNEGRIKLPYVGYYYDVASSETIFILPKVFIIENKAFGRYTPGQLLNISEDNKKLTSDDKAFLFNLSAWLYQAISLFNERNMDNEITSWRGRRDYARPRPSSLALQQNASISLHPHCHHYAQWKV